MNEGMMQEIIDDWMSWKYDILDMNKSEWNALSRDQSKLDMISIILEEKLKQMKGNK